MANDKVYPNYLMHYRTKGSKNGYSKSKYYTPVGQKAKGKWVNGRYVYDAGVNGAKNNWQQAGNLDRSMTEVARDLNNRYDLRQKKQKAKEQGAKNNWQQQGIKVAARENLGGKIAKGEVRAAKANNGDVYSAKELGYQGSKRDKAIAKGAKNDWQQQGNWQSGYTRQVQGIRTGQIGARAYQSTPSWGVVTEGRNSYGTDNSYKNALTKNASAKKSSEGSKNSWQQQANYQKEKDRKINGVVAKGKSNNWQQAGDKERTRLDYLNLLANDKFLTKKASAKKMASPQTNAMRNDPRYGNTVRVVNYNTSQNAKNVPYYNQMAKATNKQEFAAAKAKSKQALNDFAESYKRNKRSDIGNAIADAKEDAKKKWKDIKKSAKKTASKIGKKGKSLVEKFKNLFK